MKFLSPLLFIVLFACKFESSPETYFDVTTLNSNRLSQFGSKYFKDLQLQKLADLLIIENGTAKKGAASYVEYVQKNTLPEVDKLISDVKNLKETEETKLMIQASLDLFVYAKKVYETDYIKIAKMMDQKALQMDIDNAVKEMEEQADTAFSKKYKRLLDIALPYAKKHNIKVMQY